MKVTEHNVTECDLSENEIKQLIRLVKLEIGKNDDIVTKNYYGIILGKLIIMMNSNN